ncbi:MAG TPA: hypothetical protein ENN46_04575 [Candidatus Woesearchaeota archaeon]|nr:hypothetical protein [Candidatus Woesearchaeota archaeon]
MKRSQVSIEYVITVGFAVLLVIPLLIFYLNTTSQTRDAILESHAVSVVNKICNEAEKIFSQGSGSKVSFDFTLPREVTSVAFHGRNYVAYVSFSFGDSFVNRVCAVELTHEKFISRGYNQVTLVNINNTIYLR